MAIAKDASLGKTGASAAATTIVLTTAAAAANATAIFVLVAWWDPTFTLNSVADSASNVYTVDKKQAHTTGTSVGIASCSAPAGLANGGTITATFSGSTAERQIGAVSFTGFGGKPVIDGTPQGQFQSTTASWTTPNIVTSAAEALVIGGSRSGGTADGSSVAAGGNTEEFDQVLAGFADNQTMVYQIGGPATYTINGTWNVSMAEMATVGVAYQAASFFRAPDTFTTVPFVPKGRNM